MKHTPAAAHPKIITFEELPDVLTAKPISEHLHLSKQRVYELFRLKASAGGIKNFEFGRSKRTMKEDYLDWLAIRKKESK
ncbi:MAG: hypothetical protein H6Q68_1973 [Firmicutes bacterium]|nr:hypothetical protein [Bacillota bacterium]